MSEMAGVEWVQDSLFPDEITHHCPLAGSGVTGCCGKTPFELPRTDRITMDPELVKCPGIEGKNWCDPCEGWIEGNPCDLE